jgi:hypothetical protein
MVEDIVACLFVGWGSGAVVYKEWKIGSWACQKRECLKIEVEGV